MERLLGIGEVARASGLPVSALRFYDGAGVLRPAVVDPRTGYRRYSAGQVRVARLVARLRRVGMPLADVRALLAGAEPGPVLDAHLRRLEDGLADARRELSAVRTILDPGDPMPLTLPAPAFATAYAAVRYAVGTDPAYPVLSCVLVERDGTGVRLAATDRFRLAVAAVDAPPGEPFSAAVPAHLLDGVTGDVTIAVTGTQVTVTSGGRTATAPLPDGDFPDWRALGRTSAAHRIDLDVAAFRAAVDAAPAEKRVREQDGAPYEMVVLTVGPGGELAVAGEDGMRVAVNRDYLLDALRTGDQLVLELDGPSLPLALRVPAAESFSLVMPVRL